MKVICIDDRINCDIMPSVAVKEGQIYTVVNSETDENELFYQLEEYPDELFRNAVVEFWFTACAFIPLSEIDEMEMERKDFYAGSKSGLSFIK